LRFLKAFADEGVNIISLGAGYDSTFFWLSDTIEKGGEVGGFTKDKLTYIEIDFDDIVTKKINIIK